MHLTTLKKLFKQGRDWSWFCVQNCNVIVDRMILSVVKIWKKKNI